MTTQQINNEYEKLLHYFEENQVRKKESPTKKPQDQKKEKVSFDTKKFIEEAKIPSFMPIEDYAKAVSSKGFDVQKFEAMMRTKLIEEHKKIQSYERPYISVTEICGCIRQAYYVRMRYPVNLNEQFRFSYLYLIQRVGDRVHEIIEELSDFSELEKTIVSEKYKVKGRVDGIRENFIYEVKSIDVDKFKNKYLPEHYLQGLIYAYILNTEYDYNINYVTIIYVTRNLKKIVPFDIEINNKLAESLLGRAVLLKSSLKSNQVPDPIGSLDEHCKYCLYKKQCEKDKYGEVPQPFNRKKEKEKEKPKEDKKAVFLLS